MRSKCQLRRVDSLQNITMKLFIVLCAVVSVAVASPFQACNPAAGKIAKVAVKDCSDDVSRCTLTRGTDAEIAITFTPQVAAKQIKIKAYGIIAGVPIPYPLNNNDGCKNTGLTCPVNTGTEVTYTQSFKVEDYYPALDVDVKWTLVNENGEQLLCAMIPVTIE